MGHSRDFESNHRVQHLDWASLNRCQLDSFSLNSVFKHTAPQEVHFLVSPSMVALHFGQVLSWAMVT
jgi:hypothetical protein